MKRKIWALLVGVLSVVMMSSGTVFAKNAEDADGDGYCDADVEIINSLIHDNVLNWTKDDPESWNVSWGNVPGNDESIILDADVIWGIELTGSDFATGGNIDLTSLGDLYSLTSLSIRAAENITELDVSGLSDLHYFECRSNINLGELNIDGMTSLRTLDCQSNGITSLGVSDLVNLTELRCAMNRLTTLDLSGLNNLGTDEIDLWIVMNPFESITFPNGNTLTLDSTAGGYISPWRINLGENTVELVPFDYDGYVFENWASIPDSAIFTENGASTILGEKDVWTITMDQDISVSAVFAEAGQPSYTITEGGGSTWNTGSGAELIVKADGNFEKFEAVKIDGAVVDPQYYSVRSGSTIVSLKPEFLNTLSAGAHRLEIVFEDGSASTYFEIKQDTDQEKEPQDTENTSKDENDADNGKQDSDNRNEPVSTAPKTGDENHIVLYIVVMILALCAVGYTFAKRNKNIK